MKVTFLTTPGGEELAVLPRAELQELVDLADARAAVAERAAGRDPGLTAEQTRELLDAPSTLTFWRRYRARSQAELAIVTGIPQSTISQIEAGHRKGTLAQWRALARALDLSLDDLAPEN